MRIGKLYEDTRKIVPKVKKLYGYPPIQPFYQREVERIINEAKAEFAQIFNDSNMQLYEGKLFSERNILKGIYAQKCYEKWFGDGKDE